MKKFFTFCVVLTLSVFSLSACDEDNSLHSIFYEEDSREEYSESERNNEKEPSSDYSSQRITKISYLMNTISSSLSMQGSAIYGTTLFQFANGHSSVFVYDLENKKQLGTISTKKNSKWHNNQATFSHSFYDESDEFPLLYVSQIEPSEQSIQVWRIVRKEELFDLQLVQQIKLPYDNDNNNLFHFNIVIDDHDEFFWLYSRNRTTSMGQISKWKLPDFHMEKVTLEEDDILFRFPIDLNLSDAQGGTMFGQRIYFVQGVPNRSALQLHIINTNTQQILSFNLREFNFSVEPEGLSFFHDHLICATNRKGLYEIFLNAY